MAELRQDVVRGFGAIAMKSAPPVSVGAWAWVTKQLPAWVALATLLYITLQAAHLVWKWQREVHRERRDSAAIKALMMKPVAGLQDADYPE